MKKLGAGILAIMLCTGAAEARPRFSHHPAPRPIVWHQKHSHSHNGTYLAAGMVLGAVAGNLFSQARPAPTTVVSQPVYVQPVYAQAVVSQPVAAASQNCYSSVSMATGAVTQNCVSYY